MIRKILAVVVSVLIMQLCLQQIRAEELKGEKFFYLQDFEEIDPVSFWATNGKYTVNFKGLTEEKAFSGKKCFI